jgi:type I restriction enzyme S subunit
MREDWIEVELGGICEKAIKVKRKEMPVNESLKYIDIGVIDNKTNKITGFKEYTWIDAPSRAQQIIKKGDTLFSTVRTYLKNIAQVDKDEYTNEICSSGFTVLRGVSGLLNPNYLFHYSLSIGFLNPLNRLQTGTSYPAVRDKDVFAQILPLPPLPIQRAIVAKIETLFSDLDNGIADLNLAQEKLKIYRQAVLKKAFEGELTKTWREQQTDLPTAEELLEQIKQERKKHYEQQLENWKQAVKAWDMNGKDGRKPGKPKAQKDLLPLTDDEYVQLTKLPEKWSWCKIGNVTICLDRLRKPINKEERKNRIGEIPYYGANGQVGWIDDYLFDEELVIVVEDETFTGRQIPFSYKISGKTWVNNHAHVLKNEKLLNIDYLNYSLMFYPFTPLTTGTTGRKKLTQIALNNAAYSFCSKEEQHQIVREIESRLSVCDKVEQNLIEGLEKAKALRQSILKKAFEGKLLNETEIAQCKLEADYEPAGVLLERIKEEK